MVSLENVFPQGKVSLVGLPFTPFQRTQGIPPVNLELIPKLAEIARKVEVDTLIIGGTTDEFTSLSLTERMEIARTWRKCIRKGMSPKLILHTGGDCLQDSQQLAFLASELEMDAVLVSVPCKCLCPDIETLISCLKLALAPCSQLPAFYYHFPRVFHDDYLPPAALFQRIRNACPSIVGAKISGISDMTSIEAACALPDFGVIQTGTTQLKPAACKGARAWVCYLWEVNIAKQSTLPLDELQKGEKDKQLEVLGILRSTVCGRNAAYKKERGNYCIVADKAFMSCWTGIDIGPCRLPLPEFSEDMTDLKEELTRKEAILSLD
eukprot:m.2619 g.2619  ORF g.2619 m.2619 type:complete len:323 (-) comp2555_c0_seq1:195-1163(-)